MSKVFPRLTVLILVAISLAGCDVSSLWLSSTSVDGTSNTSASVSEATSVFSYDSTTSYQTYTVTFVTNCPTALDPVVTSLIETTPILSNGTLTLEGWYFDAGFTDPANFPLFVDHDMTLYAKWVEASAGFTFKPTLDGLGYIAESYVGNATAIAIQSTYNNKPVVALGEYLFYNNEALLSVVMPSQLRTIGLAAFKNATQLESVVVPNSVTEIGTDAFSGALSLTSITLSSTLEIIGNNAFEFLPNLTMIDIPASILEIRARAFGSASSLVEVRVRATTPPLRFANSFEGTPENMRYYVPSAVVDAYKTNENWLPFEGQIYSL